MRHAKSCATQGGGEQMNGIGASSRPRTGNAHGKATPHETMPQLLRPLPRDFYDREPIAVARDLLGKYLVRMLDGIRQVGKIVEVEAYLGPHDQAAHSARGRTARNEVMFGPPGHAYVYMIYGMHYCMNVVTEPEGQASAVLLRALQPIENIAAKCSGPALLCKAMQIDKRMNGQDLVSDSLFVAAPHVPERFSIVRRPRIGVDYAGIWATRLLRFCVKGSPFLSKK
jgi:DNA-3-methyladenine glycosylase